MSDIIKQIEDLIFKSREIYSSITIPLYKQQHHMLIDTLKNVKNKLEELAQDILNIQKVSLIQYSFELNAKKLDIFHQNFLIISNKINKHIFLEVNKKEIKNQLVNIKEEITKPQTFYELEEDLKNEINLFISFLESAKLEIKHKYANIGEQNRSSEELLKILKQKDSKILELNKQLHDYKWLDAKEKAKESLLANLENELIKRTKANEQNSTLLKMHIIKLESEISEMYRNIKKLNNDITHLDNSYLEKEKISLELIKELKTELLAARYALSKQKGI